MRVGIRDVLLALALLLAAGSLGYSITDHLQAKDHITNLEDDVYGSPLNGARANDGLVVLVDLVKALDDRVDKVESESPPSFQIVVLELQLEAVRDGFCEHLAGHTKYGAAPVYATLEDTWCKDYLE